MAEHNGWSNKPTWSTKLWLDNDEGYYRTVKHLVKMHRPTGGLSEALARQCHAWWGGQNRDGYPLDDVNWVEIAVALIEEHHADA